MSPVAIRRARKDEGPQVGALWQALLDEHAALEPRFGVAGDALARWANDFVHWVGDAAYRVVVAEQEGRLLGFITACVWVPPPIYAGGDEVYINELYVVPEARGQGVGRRLVDAVRAWAEALPAERLRIGVLAANAGGRAFWAQFQAEPLMLTLTIGLDAPAAGAGETKKKARLGF